MRLQILVLQVSVFLLALFLYPSSVLPNSLFHGDARVLILMKASMADPNRLLDDWSTSNHSNHCSWTGVKCDHIGRVMALDLSSMNITGPFPSQLTYLPTLRLLNVSNNFLDGSFPSNISKLRNLEVLDVYNNNMSGALPADLRYLVKLKHLNLGGNFFSGIIPGEYGKLTNLEFLGLHGNSLGGRIPRELGNLGNLTFLYLGYFNEFDSGIPPELGNLSKLVYLDMSSCNLSGSIPPELSALKNLHTLFLPTNGLTGPIPPRLGRLTSLKSLDLSNNDLSGEIPMELSELKELRLLNLFMNRLHGGIPSFIGDLPNLEVLQLWQNNFTGLLPQQLGVSGKLLEVDVSSNKLTGSIPPNLCKGGRLQILIILNNLFFGPIPDSLGKCNSLVKVRLGKNYLNGWIPEGLLYIPQLTMIELHNNYLSGSIPEGSINNGSSVLGLLKLSNNRLSGPLPSSIGKLSSVQNVLINGNKLTGNVPPEIGQLGKVSKIDLSNNRFSGMIPKEISHCTVLTYLDLSQNDFSGPIPLEITGMRILNYVNLSRNHLNGSIPREFKNMQSLSSADLSYNNLSGLVPESGLFSFFNASSFAGNPNLCGPHLGSCSIGSPTQAHIKGQVSPSLKLVLALGLLFCSLVFAIGAVVKARALKKERDAGSLKMTAFQKLDFGGDDVLECIKEDTVIGRGGAGIVYRGIMPNGEEVAVKKLMGIGTSQNSSNDHGFSAEIQTLGSIRHRHIVRLLAFCSNHDTNLLVYEYMPNGSLGEVLHGNKGGHLHWHTRYKIALEAAKGLCYLHHDCCPLIVHRDVKSNNILLDSNFEAHVADFGLAKFLQDSGTSECMSAIAGSYGYIAPEYAYTLKVDEKSDVYSFGVVLLELITGRKPVGENEFGEGVDIVQWVKKTSNSKREAVEKIIDPRLSSFPPEEAMHIFFVALLCVEEHSVQRPTMREVVQMLTDSPKSKPNMQYFSVSPAHGKESNKPVLSPPQSNKPVSSPPPDLLSI